VPDNNRKTTIETLSGRAGADETHISDLTLRPSSQRSGKNETRGVDCAARF
jgi:hypothetical protein